MKKLFLLLGLFMVIATATSQAPIYEQGNENFIVSIEQSNELIKIADVDMYTGDIVISKPEYVVKTYQVTNNAGINLIGVKTKIRDCYHLTFFKRLEKINSRQLALKENYTNFDTQRFSSGVLNSAKLFT